MDKPTAIDLFCGAGGTTKGLQLAGFHVTGVDAKPQPRYIGDEFIQADALSLTPDFLRQYDFIIAGPPCQAYVPMADRHNHHNLIPPTEKLLRESGVPWVIENVPTAPILTRFIYLCGTMFPTLRVIRHRRFAFSDDLTLRNPIHEPHPGLPVYSFDRRPTRPKAIEGFDEWSGYVTVAGNNCSLGAASDAMQISWMTRPEIAQAIPPLYSKYIGKQVIAQRDA
jgi:DNA (cytosine-5)-methyltransferase 1